MLFYHNRRISTMREEIIKQLNLIEKNEQITIIHAVESGSRAWGFESTDSDYDVRFIYRRDTQFYLRLDPTRDVIEVPINDLLDINGWDLDKTLKLLHHSNPTLFEWCNSPIVYKTTPEFDKMKLIVNEYFNKKSCLYHYLNMANGNYREHLKKEFVKAKKYFYVLRPILACRWILTHNCPPPMLFSQLCETMLSPELKPILKELLNIKMHTPEITEIPKIDDLNTYIESNLIELKTVIDSLPQERIQNFDKLNTLFMEVLQTK